MNNQGTITITSATAESNSRPKMSPLAKGASYNAKTLDSGLLLCIYEVALGVPEESKDLLFDLAAPRHMLVASGNVIGGSISYHGFRNRFVTPEKIDITKGSVSFSYALNLHKCLFGSQQFDNREYISPWTMLN